MPLVAVVIPIYKSIPDKNEDLSFTQCLSILYKHPICIFTHQNLDISYYTNKLKKTLVKFRIEYFDRFYFESIHGYNQLLLNSEFYKRFIKYKYLLVYQLDAFVFRDELEYWCSHNLDFIGAPLIEDKYGWENKFYIFNSNNGGFSLRKTQYCFNFLNYRGPILRPKTIYNVLKENHNLSLKLIISFFIRCLGYHNNVRYFIRKTYFNEDLLFCLTFDLSVSWINARLTKYDCWIKPNLANIDQTMKFAFERFPSYLFVQNNHQLPFGCHAWATYEYAEFWKNYINNETYHYLFNSSKE